MKRNKAKSDTSNFDSNVRAEDGLRRNPEAYSLYEEILIPLGVMATIFLCCLLLALIRC
jgi:hypothetical protein